MWLWDALFGTPKVNSAWLGIGQGYSYDWCRYRNFSQCFFSGVADPDATQEAGYLVYSPINRTSCAHIDWDSQKSYCPAAEPGPNVDGGYTCAAIPWEVGGQRAMHTDDLSKGYLPPGISMQPVDRDPTTLTSSSTPTEINPQCGPEVNSSQLMAPNPASQVPEDINTSYARLLTLRTMGAISLEEYTAFRGRLNPLPQRVLVPIINAVRTDDVDDQLDHLLHSGIVNSNEHDTLMSRLRECERKAGLS